MAKNVKIFYTVYKWDTYIKKKTASIELLSLRSGFGIYKMTEEREVSAFFANKLVSLMFKQYIKSGKASVNAGNILLQVYLVFIAQ